MPSSTLDLLKDIVDSHADMFDVGISAAPELIQKAERFLDLEFPQDYKRFLSTWGTLAIGPVEFYGIAGGSLERSSIPNGIWFTATQRRLVALPHHLIVLANLEGDQLTCVEANRGDTVVVDWNVASREMVARNAVDLFSYILGEVEDFL